MTAFDVGAHVGYFTLMLSRLVGPNGHVFAFEPHPHNLAYLHRHLDLNEIQNVTVVAKAVSGKSGTATFRGDDATGSLGDGAMVVETCRLDDFPLPDFVKIDIEGGEHAALDASRLVQSAKKLRGSWKCTSVTSRHGFGAVMLGASTTLGLPSARPRHCGPTSPATTRHSSARRPVGTRSRKADIDS